MFLVEHDSERRSHKIYQWRFTQAVGGLTTLKGISLGSQSVLAEAIKSKTGVAVDFSWIAGDPLRDF